MKARQLIEAEDPKEFLRQLPPKPPPPPPALSRDQLDDTTNELIGIIWPLLDMGTDKAEIQAMINNVLDAWEPAPEDTPEDGA